MSLLPVFKIGLWNAWIFMLYHQLLCIILLGSKGLLIKSSAATPHKNTKKKIVTFLGLIYYLALIYSLFLPFPCLVSQVLKNVSALRSTAMPIVNI